MIRTWKGVGESVLGMEKEDQWSLTITCQWWYIPVIFRFFHSFKSKIFMPNAQPQAFGSKFSEIFRLEKLRYLSNLWKLSLHFSTAPFTNPCRSMDQRGVRSFWTTIWSDSRPALGKLQEGRTFDDSTWTNILGSCI